MKKYVIVNSYTKQQLNIWTDTGSYFYTWEVQGDEFSLERAEEIIKEFELTSSYTIEAQKVLIKLKLQIAFQTALLKFLSL